MDEMTEMRITLNDHKNQLLALDYRISEQEQQCVALNDLVLSVKELAINMGNMLKEQQKLGNRLQKLEEKPAARMDLIVNTIITAIIAGVVGFFISSMI